MTGASCTRAPSGTCRRARHTCAPGRPRRRATSVSTAHSAWRPLQRPRSFSRYEKGKCRRAIGAISGRNRDLFDKVGHGCQEHRRFGVGTLDCHGFPGKRWKTRKFAGHPFCHRRQRGQWRSRQVPLHLDGIIKNRTCGLTEMNG